MTLISQVIKQYLFLFTLPDKINPQQINVSTFSIIVLIILGVSALPFFCLHMDSIYLVLAKFSDHLFYDLKISSIIMK